MLGRSNNFDVYIELPELFSNQHIQLFSSTRTDCVDCVVPVHATLTPRAQVCSNRIDCSCHRSYNFDALIIFSQPGSVVISRVLI